MGTLGKSSNPMRFECQAGCTKCCEQKGFVYLTNADVSRIARFLGMTINDFELRYVYRTQHLLRLRIPARTRCPFLKNGGCSIHEVKPTQCRIFPFWPELVSNAKEWVRTATWCPGIGKGESVTLSAATFLAEQMSSAHPTLYQIATEKKQSGTFGPL